MNLQGLAGTCRDLQGLAGTCRESQKYIFSIVRSFVVSFQFFQFLPNHSFCCRIVSENPEMVDRIEMFKHPPTDKDARQPKHAHHSSSSSSIPYDVVSGATSKSMAGARNHFGNKLWSMQELLRPKKYHHCRYWV